MSLWMYQTGRLRADTGSISKIRCHACRPALPSPIHHWRRPQQPPAPTAGLAAPYYIPEGYGFSHVQVFGEPCPRRQVYYTSTDDTLRLVQTASGDPPWAFAISSPRYSTVMVNGAEAKVVEGTGETQLAWTTADNTSYWLWADLDTDELCRVAQSVAPFGGRSAGPK